MVDFLALRVDVALDVATLLGRLAVLFRSLGRRCVITATVVLVVCVVLLLRMEAVFLGIVLYAPYPERLVPADPRKSSNLST